MSNLESDYYDYMGFDPDHARRVRGYYLSFFDGAQDVVDLGCGRGEFLDLLVEHGVSATGVDADPGMAQAAADRGRKVVVSDVFAYLDGQAPASAGGVFCAHFIEHLDVPSASRLISSVARMLRPGGVFVAVVPNAACYAVLTRDYWRDPTHVRFYDPHLVAFLCTRSGLRVEQSGPNPVDHPGPPPGTEADLMIEPLIDEVADHEQGEVPQLKRALRATQLALRDLERAHRTLVWGLYEPNEVYVVARRD